MSEEQWKLPARPGIRLRCLHLLKGTTQRCHRLNRRLGICPCLLKVLDEHFNPIDGEPLFPCRLLEEEEGRERLAMNLLALEDTVHLPRLEFTPTVPEPLTGLPVGRITKHVREDRVFTSKFKKRGYCYYDSQLLPARVLTQPCALYWRRNEMGAPMSPIKRSASVVFSVVLCLTLFPLLCSSTLSALTEEQKAKARAAMAASDQKRYEESYRLWNELLVAGSASLGEEGYSLARSNIYYTAFKILEQYGDENCGKVLEWTAKGMSPGAPTYSNAYDVMYPVLIMAEGVCLARQERYELSYQTLLRSKEELKRAPPEYTPDFLREVDNYLRSVGEHVISDGDYVTNKGLLQIWIGKVISRSAESVQVIITYASKDLGAGVTKGQPIERKLSDCKLLGAISADAAMKGWRE